MQNNLLIVSLAIILSACAHTEPVINTVIQRVEIPIEVPCKATVPTRPDFNFNRLKANNNIFDKTKAALADRELHHGYEVELLAALNSCIK
jgi:hypothetical protein